MRVIILATLLLWISVAANASFFRRISPWYIPSLDKALYRSGNYTHEVINKQRIKILVWNIHKEGYEPDWQNDFVSLSHDCDFAMLQEATREEGKRLPAIFDMFESIVGESFWYKGMHSGNMTLSPFHAQTMRLLHSPGREAVIRTPKPTLITDYFLQSGQKLRLVNIHAINFTSLRQFKRHIRQVSSYLKDYKGILIWAGDFNSWSKRRTKFLINSAHKLGLQEVQFTNSSRVKKFLGHPLDHFFVRGAKVLSADFPLVTSSDHNAMLVELEL